MALVSPSIALAIFGVILIVSAILAFWYRNYAQFDRSSFHSFVVILAGLGVFVTFMFYYNVVQLQNHDQQLALLQSRTEMNRAMEQELLKRLEEASRTVPAFVLSLHPLLDSGQLLTEADPVNPVSLILINSLSRQIFAIWQMFLLSHSASFEEEPYLITFLQWSHSSVLQQQWKTARFSYSESVQELGDLLFRFRQSLKEQTIEEYQKAARELLQTPEYQAVRQER